MRAKRGSFGGAAGAWVRKKRKPVLAVPPETRQEPTITTTATTTTTIVWDEERGRVVYSESSQPSSSQQDDSDDDDDDSSVEVSAFWSSYEPTCAPRVSTEKPDEFCFDHDDDEEEEQVAVVPVPVKTSTAAVVATRKSSRTRGSYASRKRAVPLQSPLPAETVLDATANNKNSRRRSKRNAAKDDLDFDEKKELQPVSTTSSRRTKRRVSNETEEDHSPMSTSSSWQESNDSLQRDKAEAVSFSQPSSKTSLDQARSFFAQLDAKEPLKLENTDAATTTDIKTSKRCVRTRRRFGGNTSNGATLLDPAATREYKEYVAACHETGVAPRKAHDMLEHQHTFSRKTCMYDGFLDE